jgi:hypothetical protein
VNKTPQTTYTFLLATIPSVLLVRLIGSDGTKQYIVFTDAKYPDQWNVIAVKEHSRLRITDNQRTQDS